MRVESKDPGREEGDDEEEDIVRRPGFRCRGHDDRWRFTAAQQRR